MKRFFCFLFILLISTIGMNNSIKHNTIFYSDDSYNGNIEDAATFVDEVYFDYYELADTHINIMFPALISAYGTNACAPTAGAEITMFYDVFYPNLIKNFESGYYYNDKFYFAPQSNTINYLMQELYELMGTNTVEDGTSCEQFKSGLKKYFNNNGYEINFNKLSKNFNFDITNNYYQTNTPIILFLNSYEYYPTIGITYENNKIKRIGYTKVVGHVVVAYGYTEYNYYKNNNLFRSDKYLVIAFGDGTKGYLKINNTSCIEEAYTINVY